MLPCSNYTHFLLPHNPSLPSFTPGTTNPVFIAIMSFQMFYKLNHTVRNLLDWLFSLRMVLWDSFKLLHAAMDCLLLLSGISRYGCTQFIWLTIHWRTGRLSPSVARGSSNYKHALDRVLFQYGHALVHSSHLPHKTTLEVILIWF